jgi:hypothetical protein
VAFATARPAPCIAFLPIRRALFLLSLCQTCPSSLLTAVTDGVRLLKTKPAALNFGCRRLQVVVKIFKENFDDDIFSQLEVMIYKIMQRFKFSKLCYGNGKGGYKPAR